MILVSNCPAFPTNGSPASSSSAPGASPTNINSASTLPTPKTTFLRDDAKCAHFMHSEGRARNSAIVLAFSPCSSSSFVLVLVLEPSTRPSSPSPLNGERAGLPAKGSATAGVRGEAVRVASVSLGSCNGDELLI